MRKKKENQTSNTKIKKAIKITIAILRVVFFILLIGFVISVCLQRFSNNKISIFNHRMFTVITGSMEPKYKIGDVLISKEVKPSAIKVGDVISYLGTRSTFKGNVITHEVVGIDKDKNGKYFFHTQGKTNLVEDPIVSEEQIYGKVICKALLLSLIYKYVGTKLGMLIFIFIPLIAIIGTEIITTLLSKEEEKRKKLKKED